MTVTYSIDPARRLVINLGVGVLTDDDFRETQRRMRADPAFDPTYRQLFDLTGVTEVQLSSAFIRDMADHTAFAPDTRRALLVNKTVMYGMARMFQSFLGDKGSGFRIFQDRAEAEAWIGLG